ncbi:MAG: hypothetical protein CME70_08345 [Halobacteriovorax sp.]|nr:hypothetical protein [Halobacteriovorax sp.]|tara:strand:+ start:181955 stop:184510 length:2556 start_codon:yes stop_codon:yes gene_type:complete
MNKEQVVLDNKLNTVFVDSPGSTSASVQIWFRAGSALEKEKDFGIAHFLEHMFFKGTPKRPGADIAHSVESFGGELNAFTSFDYTCYYINTPVNHINETVEILMDMVSNPMFKQEDLEPEREVVFEEYRRSQDNPGQLSFQKLQRLCFKNGYDHPILGNEQTIKNFSREQLKGFRENFYNTSNSFLVVAGDLKNRNDLEKTINKFKLPSGPKSEFPKFELKNKSSYAIHKKDVHLCQLYLSIQAPNIRDGKSPAEDLAINCLGHGETSRFYKDLVIKKTLANSSGGSTMFMNDGGLHIARITFPFENIKPILKQLNQTLKEAKELGMNSKEVNKIKNQYIASKVYEMETVESFAFSLGHNFAQTNDLEFDEKFLNNLKRTTVGEVNQALKEILDQPIHLSLQLPENENEALAEKELESFLKNYSKLKVSKTIKAKSKNTLLSKYDPQVQVVTLKEGIKLLYRKNDMNPTFVMQAYMRGGLTEETKKNNGIYHLLSGTLTKGYKGVSYDDLKLDLEDKSASINGFAGKNAYGLSMHGLTDHYTTLLSHFFGTLLRPQFPAKFVSHEKKVTQRVLGNQEKDPVKICFQEVSKTFFGSHPYSRPILGSSESVKSTTRKDLVSLHEKKTRTSDILITYCGNLELEEVQEMILEKIKDLKPRKEKANKNKVIKYKPKNTRIDFDREQTQIFTGITTDKLNSKENLYLKMISTFLSGQSSELFVEVRDRQGLCYATQPVHFKALEGGYWGIYIAAGHDKVDAALKAIQDIIEKIRVNGLSREDFERIKKMIEGQTLLNIQTNDDYANLYSVPVFQKLGLDYPHQRNDEIRKLKYEDFTKGIKKALSKKFSTIIVGRS